MRLVKTGKDPKTEIWRGSCNNCGSEYEATRGELKVTDDQRDGMFGRDKNCTVCGHDVVFYPPKG